MSKKTVMTTDPASRLQTLAPDVDPTTLLGNPLAAWVRGLVERDRRSMLPDDSDDTAEWAEWEAGARARGATDADVEKAHVDAQKWEAHERESAFFIGLGNQVTRDIGPAWADKKIPGPDFAEVLAGAPVVWKGRGKPQHVYSGLNVQLLTAWRIATATLKGARDDTERLVLDRCRRVAAISAHTSYAPIDEYDPTAAVASWLYPVVTSGRMSLEALPKLGVCDEVVNTLKWACRHPGDTDESWVAKVVRDPAALALVRAQLIDLSDPALLATPTLRGPDVLGTTTAYVNRVSDMLDALDPNAISPTVTRPAIIFNGDTPGLLTDKNGPATRAEAERSGAIWLGVREDDPDDAQGWLMPHQLAAMRELTEAADLFYDDWDDQQMHDALRPYWPVEPRPLETLNILGIVYPGIHMGCPRRHVVALMTNPTPKNASHDNYHDIRIQYPAGITDKDVSKIMETIAQPVKVPSADLPDNFFDDQEVEYMGDED